MLDQNAKYFYFYASGWMRSFFDVATGLCDDVYLHYSSDIENISC